MRAKDPTDENREFKLQRVRPAILVLQPFMKKIETGLDDNYDVHRAYDAAVREIVLPQVAAGVRGVVTGGAFGLPRVIMDSLPKLEIIAVNGIGTDAIDLNEARRRNV